MYFNVLLVIFGIDNDCVIIFSYILSFNKADWFAD